MHVKDKLINRKISRFQRNKHKLSYDQIYVNLEESQPKRANSKVLNSRDPLNYVNTTLELDNNNDKNHFRVLN